MSEQPVTGEVTPPGGYLGESLPGQRAEVAPRPYPTYVPAQPPVGGDAAIRLEPRSAVLVLSGFLTVLLAAALALMPVRYAVLKPGPVFNTLGSQKGVPLISITGHPTYPAKGTLDLTTVTIYGGPGGKVSLLTALEGWLDNSVAVVPQEALFPPNVTQKQNAQENRQEMTTSQESATAAALSVLGIHVPTTLQIVGLDPSSPAASVLQPKDVVLAVDSHPITDLAALRAALQNVPPGGTVTVRVRRNGTQRDLKVRTHRGDDGRTLLGVFIDPQFHFPFTVKISIENIGGPSAGTMFALGIIDKLTPGDMTGGKHIAGTGAIDPDGTVMPIGGIQQKMVAARRDGATWFLAPSQNCADVVGHVPDGLHVTRIATLAQAKAAVEAIAAGKGDSLPTCG